MLSVGEKGSSQRIGQERVRVIIRVSSFLSEEVGTSMVEWALLATLIVLVCVGAMTSIGNSLVLKFQAVAAAF